MTARACLAEPPCDCWMVMVSPAFSFQYLVKATLNSSYSSRVGSYETFKSLMSFAREPTRRTPILPTQSDQQMRETRRGQCPAGRNEPRIELHPNGLRKDRRGGREPRICRRRLHR